MQKRAASAPAPLRVRLPRIALALALGTLGGAAAAWLRLPLAWMIGAMFATTIAAVAGAPVAMTYRLRGVMITVLGIMLGSAFRPELPAEIPGWLPSLACLALFGAASTGTIYWYFRRVPGYDPVTSFFSAVPGGLTQMLIVGTEEGGDARTIALIHAARVLLVVATLPLWFVVFEGYRRQGIGGFSSGLSGITLLDLGILVACAIAGVILARAIRLPAAELNGPMVLSAVVHVAGITASRPPWELVALAQVVIGTAIGCRFAGITIRTILRTLLVALGSTAIMLSFTVAFALGLHEVTGIRADALVLSFSPGGLAEMSLIALALGIDAAFVSTHHVVRILLMVLGAPLVFRLIRRIRGRRRATNLPPAR